MSARHAAVPFLVLAAVGCGEDGFQPLELVTHHASGDLDVELVDDGVLAGVVEDTGFDVKLYDERDSWYLGTYLDTSAWGPVLLADSVLRADGEAPILRVDVTDLQWTAEEPLTLTVVPGSRDGWATRATSGGELPLQPDTCTITVTRDTTAERHAADLTACLRDWADANGAPAGLALDVLGASDAADWTYAAHVVLATEGAVEAACTGPEVLGPVDRSAFQGGSIDALDLGGHVAAKGDAQVVAWENTFVWGDPAPTAGGLTHRRVDGGTSVTFGAPTTFPADWTERSLDTLADPDGFVDACAVVVHEGAPTDVALNLSASVAWSL